MAYRYFFTDECKAKQAIHDCHNNGYWAHTISKGESDTCKVIVEATELASGIFESKEYKKYWY